MSAPKNSEEAKQRVQQAMNRFERKAGWLKKRAQRTSTDYFVSYCKKELKKDGAA